MKKGIILLAVTSFVLASCSGSRWSCKKRYCDIKKTTKTEICYIAQQEILVTP